MKIKFYKNSDLKDNEIDIHTNPVLESTWPCLKENLLSSNKKISVINTQNNRQVQVYVKDIVVIQSEERFCNIIMNNGDMYLLNIRLKYVESDLNLESIIRINNTTMINVEYVLEFKSQNNSRIEVFLSNSSSYYVSRYYIKNFRRILS